MINGFYMTTQSNWLIILVSFLEVRQKLHFIVQVIEQHAWRQLVVSDCFKGNLIAFTSLLEGNNFIGKVCCHSDDISLHEFECFYTIIMFCLCVAPNSAVGTDHVSTMANRTKIEAIIFAGNYLGVTHAHSYPIRQRLLYLEDEFLDWATSL